MKASTKIMAITIVALAFMVSVIWFAAFREARNGLLTVSFLNIGQGDSIFIDAPSGRQVLIDGGPNSIVLRELSKKMPWWDRSIDVVIPTHPDADHVGGLIDVLARYRISTIINSSVEGDTKTFSALNSAIENEHAQKIVAMRGQVLDLGGGTRLEILFPDRPVPNLDTNDACVVARLVYGETAFMFPCDAPQSIEKYLVQLDGENLQANVLKAGHHGSRTSSSELFVGYVSPEFAVFSRGCDNKYGHPHKEVIDTFEKFDISVLDTCANGTITFVSDGQKVIKK